MRSKWILCSYRVPRQPTRLRLAVWRRLKRLGALPVHDAVWALPMSGETRESVEWVAEEVEERGGAMLIWEANSIAAEQDRALVELFRAEANREYATIVTAAKSIRQRLLTRGNERGESRERALRQLGRLERLYKQQRRRDYFRTPDREPTEALLSALRADIEGLSTEAPSRSRRSAVSRARTHAMGD
jgi:hypothetical protein